jgi:hypothetical protein
MKKCFLIAGVLCLFMLSCKESEKPIMIVDEIFDAWQTTPIKKVSSADVMGMIQAFQKQWPTRCVGALLEDLKLPENEQDFISMYDPQYNYMSFSSGNDSPDDESLQARVWQRSNGHQLFGINIFEPNTEKQSLFAFYDYDPSSKTMTPEIIPAMKFTSDYPDAEVWYEIYPEPNEIAVYEYFGQWWGGLRHVYSWDGMNFTEPVTEFEGISTILDKYHENYDFYDDESFSKYALFDVDKDGMPELVLSNHNDECQVVVSIVEGEIHLLASTDFKRHLIFHKEGVVGDAGGCGTGCFYAHYTKLLNSVPEFEFGDMQSYNFETDKMEDEYNKDGELLTLDEGQEIFDSFGEVYDAELVWRPFR